MTESTETVRAIYEAGLRNQHAVENQAIELLERQVGRLENYPEMSARMQQHIEESQLQIQRLDELLSGFGTPPFTVKDTVMSLVGNVAAMMHAPASDEVVKNTFANYAFEHYEIASYKSLITMAEVTEQRAAMSLLQQSLHEEEAMARWIDEHIADTTRTFLARSAAGQT